MATQTKWSFLVRVIMDSFNTNVMEPIFKKIVFIGKTITNIKTKIIKYYLVWIIREAYPAFVGLVGT